MNSKLKTVLVYAGLFLLFAVLFMAFFMLGLVVSLVELVNRLGKDDLEGQPEPVYPDWGVRS